LLEERNRYLTGRDALANVTHQEVDDRGAAKSARHLLAKGSQAPNQ
jgi:hypothetical protein